MVRPLGFARILFLEWYGDLWVKIGYEPSSGRIEQDLPQRNDEPRLEVEKLGRAWFSNGESDSLRLPSEVKRVNQTNLFDPCLAIHTSRMEPLPYQMSQTEICDLRNLVAVGTREGDVHVRRSFTKEPDPQAIAATYRPAELLARAAAPA
jgi:hypothetical protein